VENFRETGGRNWEATWALESKRETPVGIALVERSRNRGSQSQERYGKGTLPTPGMKSEQEWYRGKKGENRVTYGSSQNKSKEKGNINNYEIPLSDVVNIGAQAFEEELMNIQLADRDSTSESLIVLEKRAVSKPDEITIDIGKSRDKTWGSKNSLIAFLADASEMSHDLKSQIDDNMIPSGFKRLVPNSSAEKHLISSSHEAKKEDPEGGLRRKVDNLDISNFHLRREGSSGGVTVTSAHLGQLSTLQTEPLMQKMTDYDDSTSEDYF